MSLLFITTAIITSTMKKKNEKKKRVQNFIYKCKYILNIPNIFLIKKACLKFVRTTSITDRDKQILIIKLEVLRFDLYGHFVAVDTCFELSWVESHSGQSGWVGVDA